MGLSPNILMIGLRIYQIAIQLKGYSKICFRDSYLIMMQPLDKLKDTFKLEGVGDGKQFFPYLFCTEANKFSKLQQLPPEADYIPESMRPDKHTKFVQWYSANRHDAFDLQGSLKEYCEHDTLILIKVVVVFVAFSFYICIAPSYYFLRIKANFRQFSRCVI